jgi:hypothetical protein
VFICSGIVSVLVCVCVAISFFGDKYPEMDKVVSTGDTATDGITLGGALCKLLRTLRALIAFSNLVFIGVSTLEFLPRASAMF